MDVIIAVISNFLKADKRNFLFGSRFLKLQNKIRSHSRNWHSILEQKIRLWNESRGNFYRFPISTFKVGFLLFIYSWICYSQYFGSVKLVWTLISSFGKYWIFALRGSIVRFFFKPLMTVFISLSLHNLVFCMCLFKDILFNMCWFINIEVNSQ